MKIIILLLWAGASLFAREYWIQVVSVKKETVVSPAFMERVEKSDFAYKTVEKDGTVKIWLGGFSTMKEARNALSMARCRIASDAFIIPEAPVVPMVETVPQSIAVIDEGNKPVNVMAETMPAETAEEENVQAQKSADEQDVKEEKPCICICDKKAFKKAEMAAAVDFYRNSPHYRFATPEE